MSITSVSRQTDRGSVNERIVLRSPADAPSAELLSNALQNLVRKPRVPHGAGQHDTSDQRSRPKDGFFPISTFSSENLLESPLERCFEFRRRASHFLCQRSHGASVAGIIPM